MKELLNQAAHQVNFTMVHASPGPIDGYPVRCSSDSRGSVISFEVLWLLAAASNHALVYTCTPVLHISPAQACLRCQVHYDDDSAGQHLESYAALVACYQVPGSEEVWVEHTYLDDR